MISVFATQRNIEAANLVVAALRRSVCHDLVQNAAAASLEEASVSVSIKPDEIHAEQLWLWLNEQPRKLILFGKMPSFFCTRLGIREVKWPDHTDDWAHSKPAQSGSFAESTASIRYRQQASVFGAAGWQRALERFDFTDEWNNLGYGAIRADGSIWSVEQPVQAPDDCTLADLIIDDQVQFSYCGKFEVGPSTVLWFNRPVGPIDSFEWRMVEKFLSDWKSESQPCYPVISEIPWGYDSAITMRLDCDEDITSARPLWLAYREMGVPLSLAIHTSNLNGTAHHTFLQEFVSSGGSLLSHTATHAPNWGGSYEAAFIEGQRSCESIWKHSGVSVRYGVSPFHQSPPYALEALSDAGYRGCIGGIIRNDPEFILARGGELAGLPRGFIGHSQQTMLHGDCMLSDGNPLRLFKLAYDRAFETRMLFGYLDHPFSKRYQYGWTDEAQRIKAHRQFIEYICTRSANPLFLDEIQAMEFLRAKSAIQIASDETGYTCFNAKAPDGFTFGIEFKGIKQQLINGEKLL